MFTLRSLSEASSLKVTSLDVESSSEWSVLDVASPLSLRTSKSLFQKKRKGTKFLPSEAAEAAAHTLSFEQIELFDN